jgi:murein L,D-transpeptidase YafK
VSRPVLLALAAAAATLALASDSRAQVLPRALVADRLVVHKAERTLTLYWRGAKLKSYRIALGGQPLGPKAARGDQRTPEGLYVVSHHHHHSDFHAALGLSYPNAEDRARAKAAGVSPGGGIEIHGLRDGFDWLGSAHVLFDWTDGCIAVTNKEIEELVRAVPDGTPVEILP